LIVQKKRTKEKDIPDDASARMNECSFGQALSQKILKIYSKLFRPRVRTEDADGAFEDFLIFSDSRQHRPAVWAGLRSATLVVRRNELRNDSVFSGKVSGY